MEDLRPVYAISVAAELAGMHPQTLRQYDRLGLVSPQRVNGRNRLYSARDVERLREVADLSAAGISLEGIRRVLDLQAASGEAHIVAAVAIPLMIAIAITPIAMQATATESGK